MFKSLLIANRGEIACRIMRTARRLGVRTVAVYSDADAGSRHTAMADAAIRIGPAPAAESYLRADAILAAARAAGATAIHPGYGFLAENADFAQACADAGLVFVGPPAAAIRAMGEKGGAKLLMEGAGVPVVPGSRGNDQRATRLRRVAEEIGFPVVIKPVAGGGGKGMRVVARAAAFDEALQASRREAKGAFGDARVLIEKWIARPRHIEIQVFADSRGAVVHLFERECSIQRRHQKVIEEAPAPRLDAGLRVALCEAAVAAARAIGYVGAGTVEFIVDARARAYYFMEMNTRLQVEHPVTEMVTGHDLVEWQLRIASGEPLPVDQDSIGHHGHAVEARVYAENPERDFVPAAGHLRRFRMPAESRNLRVDTGYAEGDEVGVHYDPLIAKVIAWDRDRTAAVKRLGQALEAVETVGVAHNTAFLAAVTRHPAFAAARIDTGYLERHRESLIARSKTPKNVVLALTCLDTLFRRRADAAAAAGATSDPHSPWSWVDGWRMNGRASDVIVLRHRERQVSIAIAECAGGWTLDLPGGRVEARGQPEPADRLSAEIDGVGVKACVIREDAEVHVVVLGATETVTLVDPLTADAIAEGVAPEIVSPLPGRIVKVMAKPGQAVKEGAALVIVEAMKMEHTFRAPADGRVERINYRTGDIVAEGADLVVFVPHKEVE